MEQLKEYTANLEEGSFLFGVESWEVGEGDVIATKNGLEEILKKFPMENWENYFLTKSRKKYLAHEILDYGKRVA